MKFYWLESKPQGVQDTRFNSQRDEILPYVLESAISGIAVSIPNGMKFYAVGSMRETALFCFNSQRDEILLEPTIKNLFFFSFNSQRDEILHWWRYGSR